MGGFRGENWWIINSNVFNNILVLKIYRIFTSRINFILLYTWWIKWVKWVTVNIILS